MDCHPSLRLMQIVPPSWSVNAFTIVNPKVDGWLRSTSSDITTPSSLNNIVYCPSTYRNLINISPVRSPGKTCFKELGTSSLAITPRGIAVSTLRMMLSHLS